MNWRRLYNGFVHGCGCGCLTVMVLYPLVWFCFAAAVVFGSDAGLVDTLMGVTAAQPFFLGVVVAAWGFRCGWRDWDGDP